MKIDYSEISFVKVALLVWQLPQALIGLLIYFVLKIEPIEYTNKRTGTTVLWIPTKWQACCSLGPFVFARYDSLQDTLNHETGHTIQSAILGPVFLLAVALPSVFLFWCRRLGNKSYEWYMNHYPENWANKLGGVTSFDREIEH